MILHVLHYFNYYFVNYKKESLTIIPKKIQLNKRTEISLSLKPIFQIMVQKVLFLRLMMLKK